MNQAKQSEQTTNKNVTTATFSVWRRSTTALLVLMAAMLLGYVLYFYVLPGTQGDQVTTASSSETQQVDLEITDSEKLEYLHQETFAPPSDESLRRLEALRLEEGVPLTPEQQEKLEQLQVSVSDRQ